MTDPVDILLPDAGKINHITDVIKPGKITSYVGGGGKTHSMFTMGKELAKNGYSVIMTTTTKIRPFEEALPEHLFCVGCEDAQGKLRSVDDPDSLKEKCDFLLIEADGSRGLPIKAPQKHEPVISRRTDLVIAVLGLRAVGRPICEVGHRVDRICDVLRKEAFDLVTEEDIVQLLLREDGLRKGVCHRNYAVILNQADGLKELRAGKKIASMLPGEIPCVMTSYCKK